MLRNWLRNKLNDPAHFYLLIGLVFSLVFAGLFAAIAEDVVTHADLAVLDTRIESQLLAQMTPASANVLNDISYLGDATFIALVSLGLLGWWAWKKQWPLAFGLLMSIAGGGLLTYLLKILFQRPRPNFPKVWIHETDFSFPSGHAMMSILFYGFLAYFLIQHISNRKWQMAIGLCAGLISFLVGLSGLFLGVHYPTDGLGGWVMGAMWLALCISVSSIIGRSNFPTIRKQTFEK